MRSPFRKKERLDRDALEARARGASLSDPIPEEIDVYQTFELPQFDAPDFDWQQEPPPASLAEKTYAQSHESEVFSRYGELTSLNQAYAPVEQGEVSHDTQAMDQQWPEDPVAAWEAETLHMNRDSDQFPFSNQPHWHNDLSADGQQSKTHEPTDLRYQDDAGRDTLTQGAFATTQVSNDAQDLPSDDWPATNSERRLIATGIAKSFGKRLILKDIELEVERGKVIGLLGPNGAGKTTSFYIVCGLLKPDSGQVLMNGQDISRLPVYQRARMGLGYLPQEASIFRGLSVEKNIMSVLETRYSRRRDRKERLEALLDDFSIQHIRKSPALALSGGERRRVEIARALAADPTYILLDEPFAGVDPIAVGDIRKLVAQLKNRDIGVLITDHNVRDTLTVVDEAYIIYEGRVLKRGKPEEIVADDRVRRVYLGENFKL